MVLFLRQAGAAWTPASEVEGVSYGPRPFGGMEVSVTWIEGGQAYAFHQRQNPGASLLTPSIMSEEDLRKVEEHIVETRDALRRAKAEADPMKRVVSLLPLTNSDVHWATKEAFRALGECGEAAVPALEKMLGAELPASPTPDMIRAFRRAAGLDAEPCLLTLLLHHLAHWKKISPGLKVGWWNDFRMGESKRMQLQRLYCCDLEALRALRPLHSHDARNLVREFRDFWRSLPQLGDRSGINQLSAVCDFLLR